MQFRKEKKSPEAQNYVDVTYDLEKIIATCSRNFFSTPHTNRQETVQFRHRISQKGTKYLLNIFCIVYRNGRMLHFYNFCF